MIQSPVLSPPSKSVSELFIAVADAGAAADRAAMVAADAWRWTKRIPSALEDAGDAACAAMRARQAAERAAAAPTASGAWSLARLAWAAEMSAEEANARVTAQIVDEIVSLSAECPPNPRSMAR